MLIQEFGLRQEDVAERVAKNRATITNSMRLLKLDERVQEMLIQDRLTGGQRERFFRWKMVKNSTSWRLKQ